MGDKLLLDVFVNGLPAPQGSKRLLAHGAMVESSKRVKPWRTDIMAEVVHHYGTGHPTDHPVAVELYFNLPRPKSHHLTGVSTTGKVREYAPRYPQGRPDLDKLVRAVLDALGSSGCVWRDDSQVCHLNTWKTYATPDEPVGVQITVRSLA